MPVNLRGRSLDSLLNFTTDEVNYLINLSLFIIYNLIFYKKNDIIYIQNKWYIKFI